MQKFNEFNGRKIVKSATRQGLINKMKDSETRNWKAISEVQQYNFCGQWVCVMELQNNLENDREVSFIGCTDH